MNSEEAKALQNKYPTQLLSCEPEGSVGFQEGGKLLEGMYFQRCSSKSYWKLGIDILSLILNKKELYLQTPGGPKKHKIVSFSDTDIEIIKKTHCVWVLNKWVDGQQFPDYDFSTTEPDLAIL